MSEKYKVYDNQALTFVTMGIVDWMDLFTREVYKEIVIDSLKYCKKEKGLVIYAFVIMSNHLHLFDQRNHPRLQETYFKRDGKRN